MLLTGPEIERRIADGTIVVHDPIRKKGGHLAGSNSLDVQLDPSLLVYSRPPALVRGVKRVLAYLGVCEPWHLDAHADNPTHQLTIPSCGLILEPGELYLGCTHQWTTSCEDVAPMIEGRSSVGRLGMCVHVTAGVGDVGFTGKWTFEIVVVHPLKVYPSMTIGQLLYFLTHGVPRPYRGRYQNQAGTVASRYHEG